MPSSSDGKLQIILDCGNDISDTRDRKIITNHVTTGFTASNQAEFVNDGRDGLMKATFANSQLPEAGLYEVQSYIETITDGIYYGEIAEFTLSRIIEEQII